MLASVSSALVLGTFLGVGEAGILAFLAGPMLTLMGVSVVRVPAFVRSDSFSVAINMFDFLQIEKFCGLQSLPMLEISLKCLVTVSGVPQI